MVSEDGWNTQGKQCDQKKKANYNVWVSISFLTARVITAD